jgi:hypothetical protein
MLKYARRCWRIQEENVERTLIQDEDMETDAYLIDAERNRQEENMKTMKNRPPDHFFFTNYDCKDRQRFG